MVGERSTAAAGTATAAIVALFVIIYYFYELGTPILNTKPRLEAQDELQQVHRREPLHRGQEVRLDGSIERRSGGGRGHDDAVG